MNILVPIPATSTISAPLSRLRTSAACGTSSNLIASLCSSCSSVQIPQSGLLQCMDHSKPPCHLLSLQARPCAFGTFTLWNVQLLGLYSPFKAHTLAIIHCGFVPHQSLIHLTRLISRWNNPSDDPTTNHSRDRYMQ